MKSRKTKKRGLVKQFKRGRVCKKIGCKQALSVYNAYEYCHLHLKESLR